jgi:tetratricopeptide (TPR) repeat protein
MELVRGIPITEYCDREQLSITERLELFVLVCRAVQHAHQKGIIHRDLKPSNVLVTVIDGVAVPKVIDFGVAKATGPSLTERTLFTGLHQFVGTPLYMSPEQADLAGVDVDTRSDVYALGVLLYELLTGTTPFDQETFQKAALDEVRRIIREEEPPKPSTRLSSLGEERTAVSASRRSDARRLERNVRGELDWIVMRALEKDRSRRYQTVNDCAADVMRYLTDRPVEACPPSLRYRLGKFARRNRATLITAVLVAVALMLGLGTATWQAVEATRARGNLAAALERSDLVIEYLVNDVFGAAAPEKTRGRTPTIHDVLAAGEKAIPARLGNRPLVEAAAREALGRAYFDLGRYDEAAEQFRRAAALHARLQGPEHPDALAAEARVVRALCPEGLSAGARVDLAEPIARRVLAARRRVLGADHPDTFASMTALARVRALQVRQWVVAGYHSRKNAPVAEPLLLLEQAFAGQARRLGPVHPATLETLDALGYVFWTKADHQSAAAAYERAIEGRRRALGPGHPKTLQSTKMLAWVYNEMDRWDEAIRLSLAVTEAHRQTYGLTHIQTSSPVGQRLDFLRSRGRAEELRDFCEGWTRQVLAMPLDPDPYQRSRRAITLHKMAMHLVALPRPVPFDVDLVQSAVREAAALDGGWYGQTVLGTVYYRTGQLEEAQKAFQSATQQRDWDGGNDLYWFALAALHARRGDLARAAECDERGRAPDTSRDSLTTSPIVDNFRAEAADLLGVKPDPGAAIPKTAPESTQPPG